MNGIYIAYKLASLYKSLNKEEDEIEQPIPEVPGGTNPLEQSIPEVQAQPQIMGGGPGGP
jgi:hypothetical protein